MSKKVFITIFHTDSSGNPQVNAFACEELSRDKKSVRMNFNGVGMDFPVAYTGATRAIAIRKSIAQCEKRRDVAAAALGYANKEIRALRELLSAGKKKEVKNGF